MELFGAFVIGFLIIAVVVLRGIRALSLFQTLLAIAALFAINFFIEDTLPNKETRVGLYIAVFSGVMFGWGVIFRWIGEISRKNFYVIIAMSLLLFFFLRDIVTFVAGLK